jgi:hypothetical protein
MHPRNPSLVLVSGLLMLGGCTVPPSRTSTDVTPGYNNRIPEKLMTPDRVETRIGTLDFFDGMPSARTVELTYDNLDFMHGVETFLNGIPAASIESMRRGMVDMGATTPQDIVMLDRLMDSNPLFLTGNTDTVYASVVFDLAEQGPMVIEVPPGCGPGTVNDAFFRFVVDMGMPGPDRGAGGKYLILPPEYDGPLDPPVGGMKAEIDGEPYFVAQSTSHANWLILRGFLVDGKPDAAAKMFAEQLRIYAFDDRENPPPMRVISGSEQPFNTIHANDFEFYEELHTVIDREPISMLDPELRGLFASIGIQKGKPFDPDPRMQRILEEAVAVGNATARAIFLRPRLDDAYLYPDSGWIKPFVGGSYAWLPENGARGIFQEARTLFFYCATVNTPAMAAKMVGRGSQYGYNATDSDGEFLDGSKRYRLNIPANVPAKDFWSVVAYDPQTRSELQTGQPFPSRNNKRDALASNADGSVDLYFGPTPPEGHESNWIQTVPGKGWFVLIRLYGPLEPWFDRTWKPGEFERLD